MNIPASQTPANKLIALAKRAALRKSDSSKRHTPNKSDLRIASEHAQLLAYPQYQAVLQEDKT